MTERYRDDLERRFRAKWVEVPGPRATPCRIWTGKRNGGTEYGSVKVEGRARLAHHVAFFIEFGFWPEQLNHLCHRPACVRVGHAYQGTHRQNMQDRRRDGTDSRGERNASHKLTEALVRWMRKASERGWTLDQIRRRLRERHGVTINRGTACKAVTGRTWRHV